LYTAFRPERFTAIIAPFEKKYGIKVKPWRSGSDHVHAAGIERSLRQAFLKWDLVMEPAQDMEAIRREQLLQPVKSPYFKDLIKNAVAGPSRICVGADERGGAGL